ncbi:Histidine kinase domain protein [Verrucomicrobiia bacterium DG1235]|nr:Histidine kinase domain protein [Verrucomicrobiae bacterium DG1235]
MPFFPKRSTPAHRFHGWLCLLATCTFALHPLAATESPLTDIDLIKTLSREEAATRIPVLVEGTVILTESYAFVLHDGQSGIFVYGKDNQALPFGTKIRLEGSTERGEFAPSVRATRITVLGQDTVTPLPIENLDELESGTLDCQWIEIEGTLRNAQGGSDAISFLASYATLAAGPKRLHLAFSETPFETVQSWVGARVRIRAACLHFFNSHGQLYGARLIVPNTDSLAILENALPPESVPLVKIESLLRYSPQKTAQTRVHIRGTVTYKNSPTELYLQEGQRGIFVHAIDPPPIEIGDTINVLGFTRRGLYSPEIEDAVIEISGQNQTLLPRPLSVEEAKTADGELVQVEATLIDSSITTDSTRITLKSDNTTFTASIPHLEKPPSLPAPGSRLQLAGIARVDRAPDSGTPFPWLPTSFELLLRSPQDLLVLQRPPISTTVWIFATATAATSLSLLIAAAFWWISHKKLAEQQRRRIIREAEFAAMIKERMRLAREIHDNLAQGFTAVSIQLETAKHKLPAAAAPVRSHLDQASALVRESLADARRSIQGLRHESLSNADFLAALERIAGRVLKDTPIAFQQELKGDVARLGAEAENELIAIATEAITNTVKHAQAKRIQISCQIHEAHGTLSISDDGIGFRKDQPPPSGFGLQGMQERAAKIHATLTLDSSPKQGTRITIHIPIDS